MVVGLESLAFLSVQRLGRGGAPGLWKKHWTCFEIQLTTCVSRDTSLHFSGQLLRTPKSFCLYRLYLYLYIFIVLEIKIQKCLNFS